MSEIEKKWYVLRAVSGKESKVKEYLDADIKNSDLSEYVSQVLIPTEKVYQVRNGKKIVKERSYLPGYVLVEAALVGEVAVGPFSGFSGLIEEVNTEKRKLKVMVKIFGRKTPLELGFMDVEKESYILLRALDFRYN